jgi:hypothetical protein
MSTVCLSMYNITENIYYSQPSSVAILLLPEPVSHHINTRKGSCSVYLSLSVLSSCRLPLPPNCLLVTANEARSYFASTIKIKQRRLATDMQALRGIGRIAPTHSWPYTRCVGVVSVTTRPHFNARERTTGTHWIGDRVGLRAALDTE